MTTIFRIVLFSLAIFLITACASAAAPQANTPPTAAPSNSGAQANAPAADSILQVVTPNGAKSFSLKDLQALPASTITVDGKPQDGPALLEVLKAAGVTDFKEVTLTGSSTLTLSYDQVNAEVILDFNNRGLVKFASTTVPQANWPKDLSKIEVK